MSLYDIEKFDPPPDPDLICCICQCVLYKAVESPCRHVFCQSCIERWLSKRHTCPTCRKRTRKDDLKPVLPLVQNMLNRDKRIYNSIHLNPHLICCICQCVLYKAVESPCRHVFCQACIERWLSKRHTCPTCRKRTRKDDLKPVLPLVQNMLNRLPMKCDYFNNGCVDKIMLEQYEAHVKDCGYEMKTCRFVKCARKILKMDIDQHESELCEHRESICDGDCGLMIALSDKPTHNCVTALKAHIDEKNRMIETLKAKLQELNNLSQTLNDQLEQLGQQIDENRPISFSPFLSSESSDSVVSDMSDDLNEVSMDVDSMASSDTYENDTGDVDVESFADNNDRNDRNEALDVVQQVERTVVSSLIDLSSRLERVRNQMRSVLDRGVMDEDNNLNDDVHIPSDALNAIVNNSQNVTSTSGPNTDGSENTSRVEEANTTTGGNSRVYNSHDADERVDSNTRGNEPGTSAAEYSPSYYYSHSDHSDGEWDPDSTNTNTNQNEIPASADQRDVSRWSTQRWVRSVLLSPVHIIESQPPRSPSESETSYSSIPSMSSIHSPRLDRTYNENQDVGGNLENGRDNQFQDDNDDNSCQSFGSQSSVRTVTEHSRSEADNMSTGSRDDHNANEDESRHSDTGSFVDHSSGFDNYRGSSIDRSPNHDSDWSRRSSTPKHEDEDETDREENEEETGDLTDYLEGESRDSGLSERSNDKTGNEDLTFFGGLNDRSSTLDYESDNDHSRSPWSGFSAVFSSQESDGESKCSVKSRSSGNPSSPVSVQSGPKENDVHNSIWYESDISEKEDGEVTSTDSEGAVSVNASHHISISSEDSEPSDQEHGRRTWKYETKPSTQVNKSTATITSATTGHESENSKSKKGKSVSKSPRSITSNKDNNRAKGSSQSKPSSARDVQNAKCSINDKTSCNKTITSATSTVQSDNDSRKIYINRKRRQDSECDAENNKRSKYNNSDRSQTQTNQTYRQASSRTDTNNIKVETGIPTQSNQDKNTQSLNVKIDLSLINYTGNILTQSVSQPAPSTGTNIQTNQASVHVRQPNLSSTQQKNTRQAVNKTTTNTTSIGNTNTVPASKRQLRSVPVKQSENQQGNTRHARSTHSSRYNSTAHETNLSDSTGTLNTSSLCSDDEYSDSESDKTWEPQGENESDVSVSEGEPESDTDYEVQIPKTAADLLDEYASDETDDSWTCGVEDVD